MNNFWGKSVFLTGFIAVTFLITTSAQEPANNDAEFKQNYEWRVKQEYLLDVYIPKDLGDAFIQLNKLIDPESKAVFKGLAEEEASHKLHFSFGRWIMVNWGFYEGSRLSHLIKEMGISYPDDMAQFLIICYHRFLNKKELKAKELVAVYKEKVNARKLERIKKGKVLHEEVVKRN